MTEITTVKQRFGIIGTSPLLDRTLEVAVSDRYPMSAAPDQALPAPLAELASEASGGSGASMALHMAGTMAPVGTIQLCSMFQPWSRRYQPATASK